MWTAVRIDSMMIVQKSLSRLRCLVELMSREIILGFFCRGEVVSADVTGSASTRNHQSLPECPSRRSLTSNLG